MIYLDPKTINPVKETLKLDEFVKKYSTIDYIKVGTLDSDNRPLVSIIEFRVSTDFIYQLSKYEKTDRDSAAMKFEQIVSFLPPKLTEELFRNAVEKYKMFADTYKRVISKKMPVINPRTFEEFDLSSPEYEEYCETMKTTLLKAENEMKRLYDELNAGRSG
jgi:hypothetical protein